MSEILKRHLSTIMGLLVNPGQGEVDIGHLSWIRSESPEARLFLRDGYTGLIQYYYRKVAGSVGHTRVGLYEESRRNDDTQTGLGHLMTISRADIRNLIDGWAEVVGAVTEAPMEAINQYLFQKVMQPETYPLPKVEVLQPGQQLVTMLSDRRRSVTNVRLLAVFPNSPQSMQLVLVHDEQKYPGNAYRLLASNSARHLSSLQIPSLCYLESFARAYLSFNYVATKDNSGNPLMALE